MTDEQRDEARLEQDEDVEGHGALQGRALRGEIDENESDDDVEAHGGLGPEPTIGPEPSIGP
jgi:hypothetical protein